MSEIRLYRETDRDAVIALWEVCGLTRPWNPPAADIALVCASGHGELLVAADGERLLGTVMVGHDGHRGWVYYMAVDPARRRQGLGTRLLRAAESWVAARGARKLELMFRESNAAATKFYAGCGYGTEPVMVMSRWLDPPTPCDKVAR